jgi:predicted extracellular nuclease
MKIFFLSVLVFLANVLNAQEHGTQKFRVMWYNVENFFDCEDDTLTNDNEFLPAGKRGWSYPKFIEKTNHIAKVITAIGEWKNPALVGLCEVENDKCLIQLTKYSPLKNFKYKFIHHDSPDPRGIDVALLYDPAQFKPLENHAVKIKFPSGHYTRDVLYVKGLTVNGDTLNAFVCHFPSRLGGELESEQKRIFVASVIKTKIDSIFAYNQHANVIVMGDFNDFPTNKSLHEVIAALPISKSITDGHLYNLMYQMQLDEKGTNKFKGEWGVLDQIFVSGSLLNASSTMNAASKDAHIFDADFLLEEDPKFMGKQPFRTYVGFKCHGGYSDHLPVYVDFSFNK